MITSKQRAYLRSLANPIDAIFQVGKSGITDNLIRQIGDALEARELIKFTVLETAPDTMQAIANEVATATNSIVVQTLGKKVTLYRAKKKNPKIVLPDFK